MTAWKLVRPANLLIIFATFALIRLFILDPVREKFGLQLQFDYLHYIILMFSCLLIAAGGYIVNDIRDVDIDRVNKPGDNLIGKVIPFSTAWRIYLALSLFGLLAGIYVADYAGNWQLVSVHVIAVVLLYLYATFLKGVPLAGNVTVALLIALTVFIPAIFERSLYVLERPGDWYAADFAWLWIAALAVFSFKLNLVREIIKDMEDEEGDREGDIRTMVTAWGPEVARGVAVAVMVTVVGLLCFGAYLLYRNLEDYSWLLIIYTALLAVLSAILLVQIYKAENKPAFSRLSRFLKIEMAFGLLGLFLMYTAYF